MTSATRSRPSWARRAGSARSLAEKGLEREAGNADAIVQSARRMNSMIQDLMESARLESGRLELRRQPADLRLLLEDLCHRLGSTEDQSRLRVECPEWAPPLPIDRERLERALENLVTNALKYSPADSPVTVRVEWREGEAA